MLVLSRKKNESIVVNDEIVITVVEIRGDKVRLGIEAPKEVPIHRSEIYAAIHQVASQCESTAESSVNGTSHDATSQNLLASEVELTASGDESVASDSLRASSKEVDS